VRRRPNLLAMTDTHDPHLQADNSSSNGPSSRWPLVRWFASSATMSVPQAAGPVAFSLLALAMLGDAKGGAAIILAMTLAQVAGAIPITRLGRNLPSATFLRLLVGFRSIALAGIALCAYYQASFVWLVVLAALAGSVNGAAFGYLRSLLNHFTPASRLPRALGIASTLNELTFVLGPVVASGLGSISPVFALLAITALGAIPVLLVPQADMADVAEVSRADGSVLNPSILLWLCCAAAGASTVAAIEIGAVALAMQFGYEPALAILFTVPLCLASVAGGIWVSVRNRMASRRAVIVQLSVMTLGAALAAFGPSIVTTVVGAMLVGFVLAPLGTHYALVLDHLAPPRKRPEVFALLRTANATGVIFASAVMTVISLSGALFVVTGAMIAVTLLAGFAPVAAARLPGR
jgi:MFS family permease